LRETKWPDQAQVLTLQKDTPTDFVSSADETKCNECNESGAARLRQIPPHRQGCRLLIRISRLAN